MRGGAAGAPVGIAPPSFLPNCVQRSGMWGMSGCQLGAKYTHKSPCCPAGRGSGRLGGARFPPYEYEHRLLLYSSVLLIHH